MVVTRGFRREGSWSWDQSPIVLISVDFWTVALHLGTSAILLPFVEVVPVLLGSPVSVPVPREPWHTFISLMILDGRWLWS